MNQQEHQQDTQKEEHQDKQNQQQQRTADDGAVTIVWLLTAPKAALASAGGQFFIAPNETVEWNRSRYPDNSLKHVTGAIEIGIGFFAPAGRPKIPARLQSKGKRRY